jgi:hypothetical protein
MGAITGLLKTFPERNSQPHIVLSKGGQRALDVAIAEINKKTDLNIEIELSEQNIGR